MLYFKINRPGRQVKKAVDEPAVCFGGGQNEGCAWRARKWMGRGEGIGTAPGRHVFVSKPVVLMAPSRETEMCNLVCLHTSPFKMSACHTPRVHIGAAAPPHPSHIRRHALNTPHKQQRKCRTAHVGAFHMKGRGHVCCAWPSDCPHTTSAPRDTRQGTRNTRDQQGGWGVAVMHWITKRQILVESLMDPDLSAN